MKISILLVLLIFCVGCKQSDDSEDCCSQSDLISMEKAATEKKIIQAKKEAIVKVKSDSIMLQNNLVDIQTIDPSIRVELKYTTTDNFTKRVLYQGIKHAYLQKDVAERLASCQKDLKKIHPNYSLLVYDAVRPVSVQQIMWDALDTIPAAERGRFVSNPKSTSVHNYGAAIDLTIIDQNGTPLDMGAGYDDIREIAYPSLEWKFIASGELSTNQIENRKLLRKIMSGRGFRNIPSEWWHFNACSRATAAGKYTILLKLIA